MRNMYILFNVINGIKKAIEKRQNNPKNRSDEFSKSQLMAQKNNYLILKIQFDYEYFHVLGIEWM